MTPWKHLSISSPSPGLDATIAVPVQHLAIEQPWGTQHVVRAGPDATDRPAIVLLHGWPEHWFGYRHVLAAFAGDFDLYAIDTRGFGWSTLNAQGASLPVSSQAIAADAVRTMDALGLDRVHLVGHDWGGWFAFHVADSWPDRVRTLTTMAIMPPWLSARQVVHHSCGLAYLAPMSIIGSLVAGHPSLVAKALRASSAPGQRWTDPDMSLALTSYQERLRSEAAQHATRRLYAQMVRHELVQACASPRPPRLPMPAEVWLGQFEHISNPEMFLGRTYPGEIDIPLAPPGGHWLLDECPDWVVKNLGRVLRR